ncbi:sulfotransferase [Thiorhodococcus mannitoliphagus]|uniref:Sulfotransferase n=1 Tax=Thiorhodococcus mannitoliphagus TaxID=329406 RepID=A0A6P1E1T1_9GAMM|nr:sulfotransferase [Thiorhodococcus mannitoliphagus]NEX23173.1 sulfotransferase [Thiorhodococcus mannitoliphagus]
MQQHSSGVFVLSMGRSGSTLLSRLLQQHPAICSISEYWTSLFMRGFGDPSLSGRDYWALLSVPPTWFGPWVEKARAAGELPAEILYDDARGRYRLRDCPPIAAMTLPALDADPDARVDALAQMVPNWPTAPVTTHSARLFDLLTTSLHKRLWVERSGLSYWYVPDLLQGFPDARYVHLHRDGREVVLSMMGMRFFDPVARVSWMLNVTPGTRLQKLLFFAKRDLARRLLLRVADLERAITRQHLRARPYSLPDRLSPAQRLSAYAHFWANTSELALEAMAKIPNERLLTLKYEQLVSAPRAELSRLIEHLLPGEAHAAWLDAVCALPQPQRARWPDLDPALAEELQRIIGPINRALGYA